MIRRAKSMTVGATAALVVSLLLAACGGNDSSSSKDPLNPKAESGKVVVGSANFPENVILAEIYAQALDAKGVKVEKKLNIGSREVLYDQIKSGTLSVLPEYNGALLAYLDQKSTATTTEDVNNELKANLPKSLRLLDSSKAEDKDSVTVTADTAKKYNLTSLSDLAPVASKMVLGGPPEFKARQQGVLGLASVYKAKFKQFKALDVGGPLSVASLKQGKVDAVNLFTTDPAIVENNFVVLKDPEALFGAQNVTPLVNESADNAKVRDTLNAISAKLDTETLGQLLKKVVSDKQDADEVAGDWLKSNGLT